ncbi:MAG: sulfur carrier protein ThiS adenylyltransferase ThiF [Candidatus Omnitrophica bacterium]|jgi:sulfur carrier protein ThiS adenylyltransferase|nr:sulfur carrier protein ThiS adenylyltransferase ThiF [Candidatus Omnitrophota bacterium]MDD5661157.1 sulfur carrier protein ThiS adenylyltransferase ThiF [Candidatus Omnitrophota bacterium]
MDSLQNSLIKKIGKINLKKIQSVRIGLAGLGGLGSNCALNLVRVGFKNLTIVDFDKVVPSNLDRQFYFLNQVGMDKVAALKRNLLKVNPELDLELIKRKINKNNVTEIFSGCDVVVECLDRAAYKKMLVEQLLSLDKFVVAVSGVAGIGSSDDIKVHRIKDKFVLVGDLQSDIRDKPALSPRVNIAAAKQADLVLDFVINAL